MVTKKITFYVIKDTKFYYRTESKKVQVILRCQGNRESGRL